MKHFDVFDKRGNWLAVEAFSDKVPDELVQTLVSTKMTYEPSVKVRKITPMAGVASGVAKMCCSFCGKESDNLYESRLDSFTAICEDCVSLAAEALK